MKKAYIEFFTVTIFIFLLVSCSSEAGTQVANTPAKPPNLPFEMRPFTTNAFGYVLDIPAEWESAVGVEGKCENAEICFSSDNEHILIISEAYIGDVGGDNMTIAEYVDLVEPTLGEGAPGYEFLSREQFNNDIGQDSEVITYTLYDGVVKVKQLWFAKNGNTLNVYYMGYTDNYDEIEETAEYSFESLRESER